MHQTLTQMSNIVGVISVWGPTTNQYFFPDGCVLTSIAIQAVVQAGTATITIEVNGVDLPYTVRLSNGYVVIRPYMSIPPGFLVIRYHKSNPVGGNYSLVTLENIVSPGTVVEFDLFRRSGMSIDKLRRRQPTTQRVPLLPIRYGRNAGKLVIPYWLTSLTNIRVVCFRWHIVNRVMLDDSFQYSEVFDSRFMIFSFSIRNFPDIHMYTVGIVGSEESLSSNYLTIQNSLWWRGSRSYFYRHYGDSMSHRVWKIAPNKGMRIGARLQVSPFMLNSSVVLQMVVIML